MSAFVEVMLDTRGLERDLRELPARTPLIMARALNRAATSGRAAMVKVISKDTGIASKNVRKEIRIDKANRTRPVVRVEIRGRRIPVIAFGAKGPEPSRGRGRGVAWRERGRLKRDPQAFIATMPSGHRGVFKRKGKSRSRKGRPRSSPGLPIMELFGPSLPHVFEKYLPVFRKAASEALEKNLRSEISFARQRLQEGA